jgi:hypothetical protein
MNAVTPHGNFRDRVRTRTPMKCPICGEELGRVIVRDLGGVTASIVWQLHAGECAAHGWFQTEVVSRPPREIFAVTKPFGAARRVVVDGVEHFAFSTVWNDLDAVERRQPVDPLEEKFWKTRPLTKPSRKSSN